MKEKGQHFRKLPAKSRAVRQIPKASKGHFVGELVYNRNGEPQRLGFASLLEFHTALCFIYRPDFHDIEEQLAGLPFHRPNGRLSHHHFDFRVTQCGGRRICVSVKPERISSTYGYGATIERVKQAAVGNICDAVVTVTERNLHPVRIHNAKLFHAARDPDPELDDMVAQHLQKLSDPISIGSFLDRANIGGSGFFSVARAIRFERVKLFGMEKITGKTLIVPKEAA